MGMYIFTLTGIIKTSVANSLLPCHCIFTLLHFSHCSFVLWHFLVSVTFHHYSFLSLLLPIKWSFTSKVLFLRWIVCSCQLPISISINLCVCTYWAKGHSSWLNKLKLCKRVPFYMRTVIKDPGWEVEHKIHKKNAFGCSILLTYSERVKENNIVSTNNSSTFEWYHPEVCICHRYGDMMSWMR